MDRTWADGRICRTRTGWLFFESSSRSIFLFEHDLRANASRLSEGKPVPTHRVVARGHAFPDHALADRGPAAAHLSLKKIVAIRTERAHRHPGSPQAPDAGLRSEAAN